MNKYTIMFGTSIISVIMGGLIVAFIVKKKAEKQVEDEIRSVRETYKKLAEDKEVFWSNRIADVKSQYMPSEEEPEDEYDDNDAEGERLSKEAAKGKPKLIKSEEFLTSCPYHDKVTLYYYAVDGVLATEEEEEVEDYERLIGDALTKFGFDMNDETVIYVRNMALSTDYEIQKVFSSFSSLKK